MGKGERGAAEQAKMEVGANGGCDEWEERRREEREQRRAARQAERELLRSQLQDTRGTGAIASPSRGDAILARHSAASVERQRHRALALDERSPSSQPGLGISTRGAAQERREGARAECGELGSTDESTQRTDREWRRATRPVLSPDRELRGRRPHLLSTLHLTPGLDFSPSTTPPQSPLCGRADSMSRCEAHFEPRPNAHEVAPLLSRKATSGPVTPRTALRARERAEGLHRSGSLNASGLASKSVIFKVEDQPKPPLTPRRARALQEEPVQIMDESIAKFYMEAVKLQSSDKDFETFGGDNVTGKEAEPSSGKSWTSLFFKRPTPGEH